MTRVRGRMGGKGKSYEEQVEEVGFTQGNIYRYIRYVVPMYNVHMYALSSSWDKERKVMPSGGLIKRIVESTEEVTRKRNIDNVRHNKKTNKDKTELKGEESDTKENSLTKKKIKRP